MGVVGLLLGAATESVSCGLEDASNRLLTLPAFLRLILAPEVMAPEDETDGLSLPFSSVLLTAFGVPAVKIEERGSVCVGVAACGDREVHILAIVLKEEQVKLQHIWSLQDLIVTTTATTAHTRTLHE